MILSAAGISSLISYLFLYFHSIYFLSLSLIIRDSFRLRCSRLLRRNRQDQKRNDIRKPAIRSVVRAACILRRHLVRSASGKQKCHHGRRKKQRCPLFTFLHPSSPPLLILFFQSVQELHSPAEQPLIYALHPV